MKKLLINEIADRVVRENFVRLQEIVNEFKTNFAKNIVPIYTTNVRDSLNAKQGMIIYNSTTGKFQGFDGTSWVDFH